MTQKLPSGTEQCGLHAGVREDRGPTSTVPAGEEGGQAHPKQASNSVYALTTCFHLST